MYSTCIHCYAPLGTNDALEHFPVGRRVAFDAAKGRLWAICVRCGQWNLAPLDERWEAIEECERRFRETRLRYSTGNVGLAWLAGDAELVRIGKALRPEVAAWRYGRVLARRGSLAARVRSGVVRAAAHAVGAVRRRIDGAPTDEGATIARLLLRARAGHVLDMVRLPASSPGTDVPLAVVRYQHLAQVTLMRPQPGRPWALLVPHDHGLLTLEGDAGLRTAGKLLAAVNGGAATGGAAREMVELAVRKIDESVEPDSYFNRVLALALRSDWGRGGSAALGDGGAAPREARVGVQALEGGGVSEVERLAIRLTGRTFWGHGGIGSEPRAALLDVPYVDRLALEMAAHEDAERRALDGELAELEAAWRDAEEIAAIADALLPPPSPA